jgi:hypothetical protein
MFKILIRPFVFLLIPCLLADPSLASGFGPNQIPAVQVSRSLSSRLVAGEALMPFLLSFPRIPQWLGRAKENFGRFSSEFHHSRFRGIFSLAAGFMIATIYFRSELKNIFSLSLGSFFFPFVFSMIAGILVGPFIARTLNRRRLSYVGKTHIYTYFISLISMAAGILFQIFIVRDDLTLGTFSVLFFIGFSIGHVLFRYAQDLILHGPFEGSRQYIRRIGRIFKIFFARGGKSSQQAAKKKNHFFGILLPLLLGLKWLGAISATAAISGGPATGVRLAGILGPDTSWTDLLALLLFIGVAGTRFSNGNRLPVVDPKIGWLKNVAEAA